MELRKDEHSSALFHPSQVINTRKPIAPYKKEAEISSAQRQSKCINSRSCNYYAQLTENLQTLKENSDHIYLTLDALVLFLQSRLVTSKFKGLRRRLHNKCDRWAEQHTCIVSDLVSVHISFLIITHLVRVIIW